MKLPITKTQGIILLEVKDKKTNIIQEIQINLVFDSDGLWKQDLKKILEQQQGLLSSMHIVLTTMHFAMDGSCSHEEQFCIIEKKHWNCTANE
ncbi:MAG: hypothetical protein QW594_01145 [Candidatus Woesearchaeota archaeon]